MSAGKRILSVRKKLGLSQEKFALPLGVNRSHIAGIESGARSPSSHLIRLICCHYHVNEKWLSNGEGDMFVALEQLIIKIISRFGRQAFLDACHKIFDRQALDEAPAATVRDRSVGSCQRFLEGDPGGDDDADLRRIIDILKLFWEAEDRRLRHWASVQFDRAFPPDMIEAARKTGGKK